MDSGGGNEQPTDSSHNSSGNVGGGESAVCSSAAVGNEAGKLKALVLHHVRGSALKRQFASMSNGGYVDEMACAEACMILRSLQHDPGEQEACCHAMLSLLTTETRCLLALDKIVTKIVFAAYEEGVISLMLTCQLLLVSVDFTFKSGVDVDPTKIEFIRERMRDKLDYKNLRDLLRLLLMDKLDKMPCLLDEYQHQQLQPIEDLVVELLDRRNNLCPSLFFITEVSRINNESAVHFLPRISQKIRELIASFRPLAEIGSTIGRSWLYPVTSQTIFSWTSGPLHTWKLQELCKLHFRTHLPYSHASQAPQTYQTYVLMKQPRGQENLGGMFRGSGSSSKIQCNEVLSLLLLEAMNATENGGCGTMGESNSTSAGMLRSRYNWTHLSHLVNYSLWYGHCQLAQLLQLLVPHLQSGTYPKSRGELMWILLQFISFASSGVKQKSASVSQGSGGSGNTTRSWGLDRKSREQVTTVFNALYPPGSELVWSGCSEEDSIDMVRFFAPPAIYIHLLRILTHNPSDGLIEKPPEKVQHYIEFLKDKVESGKELEKGVLAAVANAYSNDMADVFEPYVCRPILKYLGAAVESPMAGQAAPKYWVLPGGRQADGCLAALDLAFLDSLTFHAKKLLNNAMVNYMQNRVSNGKLPSPALMLESSSRVFLVILINSLKGQQDPKNAGTPSADLMVMLSEFLDYRLTNIQFSIHNRYSLVISALELLSSTYANAIYTRGNQATAMYVVTERIVLRQIMVTPPIDFLYVTFMVLSSNSTSLFCTPQKFMQQGEPAHGQQVAYHTSPEVTRIFLLNLCRCHKLASSSGHMLPELQIDYLSPLRTYKWPASTVKWFPSHLQGCTEVDEGPEETYCQNLVNSAEQEYRHLLQGNEAAFNYPYRSLTLFISIFHYLLSARPSPTAQMPGETCVPAIAYRILAHLSARELILNTNAFIDYLLWKSRTEEQLSDQAIRVVNDMVFVHHCISLDRFFIALVVHPNDDTSIRYAILLLESLVRNTRNVICEVNVFCPALRPLIKLRRHNHFLQRIVHYLSFAPSSGVVSRSEDYFTRFGEYCKRHPEPSYFEMWQAAAGAAGADTNKFCQIPAEQERPPLPTFYDCVCERILPVVDSLLQRCLEISIDSQVFATILNAFSPLYRLHPQPAAYLYKTLYSLDSTETVTHSSLARQFVMEIAQRVEDLGESKAPKNTVGVLLSQEFMMHGNQGPARSIRELVERVIGASTYTHRPPSFIVKDWRFADCPPATQALTGAWIELLASPHTAVEIVDSMIELALERPIQAKHAFSRSGRYFHHASRCPTTVVNALTLMLVGLPQSFHNIFLQRVVESFDWPELASSDAFPSSLFESTHHESHQCLESRALSMLSLVHAFIQHASNSSISALTELIVKTVSPKVENETQLIYFFRIMVPYLQRISEKDRQRHMPEYLKLVVATYEILERFGSDRKLEYEDTVCDLLYFFKYLFVGNSVKQDTEHAIETFPPSMREKLKFLHSSTGGDAAAAISTVNLASISQQQQQQQRNPHHNQIQPQYSFSQAQIQSVLQHLSSSGFLSGAGFPPQLPQAAPQLPLASTITAATTADSAVLNSDDVGDRGQRAEGLEGRLFADERCRKTSETTTSEPFHPFPPAFQMGGAVTPVVGGGPGALAGHYHASPMTVASAPNLPSSSAGVPYNVQHPFLAPTMGSGHNMNVQTTCLPGNAPQPTGPFPAQFQQHHPSYQLQQQQIAAQEQAFLAQQHGAPIQFHPAIQQPGLTPTGLPVATTHTAAIHGAPSMMGMGLQPPLHQQFSQHHQQSTTMAQDMAVMQLRYQQQQQAHMASMRPSAAPGRASPFGGGQPGPHM